MFVGRRSVASCLHLLVVGTQGDHYAPCELARGYQLSMPAWGKHRWWATWVVQTDRAAISLRTYGEHLKRASRGRGPRIHTHLTTTRDLHLSLADLLRGGVSRRAASRRGRPVGTTAARIDGCLEWGCLAAVLCWVVKERRWSCPNYQRICVL